MNEISFPVQPIKSLIWASIVATIVALVLFVTTILPAEYNIDPTGLGQRLGLTELAQTEAVVEQTAPTAAQGSGYQRDEVEITIPAKGDLEYKFHLVAQGKLAYDWQTDGAVIHADFHGEPEGDQTGYYESYAIADVASMQGTITVPFAGTHGWYWKNNSDQPVVIRLMTSGAYQRIGKR